MSKSNAGSIRNRSMAVRASLALAIAASLSMAAFAPQQAQARVDLGISVNIAPPPLPVYEQPMMPGAGFIWTPGYWEYDQADGYYWVPGTWIRPPYYGALWTPGYWGWREGVYAFNRGYWGRHVGYYGGINYGYGYGGRGYEGGEWRGRRFFYNSAVNRINVNIHITNVFNRPVRNITADRFSFNGPGGANIRPTSIEITYQKEKHTAPVADQVRQRDAARNDRSLRASENKGNPPVAATERPGVIAKPQGGPAANAGKGGNDKGGNDQGGNDKGALVSGRFDADKGAASGNRDNKLVSGRLDTSASSAASDRQDKAAKLREQAGVGAAANANASASSSSDAGTKPANRPKRTPRPTSGSEAQDNGNAMSSPAKQHVKQPRGDAHPPAMASQPQDGQKPMRSPRADRAQDMGNGAPQRGQGQGQPKNDRQPQPREDKGQNQERKPRDKDKNEGSSSSSGG